MVPTFPTTQEEKTFDQYQTFYKIIKSTINHSLHYQASNTYYYNKINEGIDNNSFGYLRSISNS